MNPLASAPSIAFLLGVPFHDVSMEETLSHIDGMIQAGKPGYLATANLDFAEQASRDVELQRILFDADLVLCDGTPLVWISRWFGAGLRERVAGADLLPELFAHAADKGYRVFFLGGTEDVLEAARKKMEDAHPDLVICGTYSPPFSGLMDMDDEQIRQRVVEARPDLLLVAFGCPKQEKWIYRNYRALGVPCSIGIGASLDFVAGKFKRAPVWMRKAGLEWLFRWLQEPKRLFKRYARDLAFLAHMLPKQQWMSLRMPWTAQSSPPDPAGLDAAEYLSWRGAIDTSAVSQNKLQQPANRDKSSILLDLSAATVIDSAGLGALVELNRKTEQAGGQLVVYRPAPPVAEVMHLLNIDRLIQIAPDDATASALLKQGGHALSSQFHHDGANRNLLCTLQGVLTERTLAGQHENVFRQWAQAHDAVTLAFDLSAIRFMDSSGLEFLLGCVEMAKQRPGGSCRIDGISPNALNVIGLAGLEGSFGLGKTVRSRGDSGKRRERDMPRMEARELEAAVRNGAVGNKTGVLQVSSNVECGEATFPAASGYLVNLLQRIDQAIGVVPGRLVQFIAAGRCEGVSSIAGSYAAASAQMYRRKVLLLSDEFGGQEEIALPDLAQGDGFAEVVSRAAGVTRMCLLSRNAGYESSYAVLADGNAWKRLCSSFDEVVIDAKSPFAMLLAPRADGVVVVIEADATPASAARKLLEDLAAVNAKVLGTILNKQRSYLPRVLRERF